MSELDNECDAFIQDHEYGKATTAPAKPPMFDLQILSCDYDRGWTWFLQIGRRTFTGWRTVPGEKPQPSPEKAYAHFMEWASKVEVEKLSEVITSEQKALNAG